MAVAGATNVPKPLRSTVKRASRVACFDARAVIWSCTTVQPRRACRLLGCMNNKPFTTNVVLSLEGATWLDEQCLAIRRNSGASISRSKLLRGIIAGVRGGVDFSRCKTEEDLAEVLAFLLGWWGSRRGKL